MRQSAGWFSLGLLLMVVAVAWTIPFGGFPDELDHYERALSVGSGELVGKPNNETIPSVVTRTCCAPGNQNALRWVRLGVRRVKVDQRQLPNRLSCRRVVENPRLPCGQTAAELKQGRHSTAMGTIEPVDYVPSGVAMQLFRSPFAYRVGRLVLGLIGVALIFLGLESLASSGAKSSLLGITLLMTPGTLIVLASGSPNVVEIASAICFGLCALSFARRERVANITWAGLAVGGFALATSRSLGPIWILLSAGVAVLAGNFQTVRANVGRQPTLAWLTAASIGVGSASTVLWEALVQPHVPFDFAFFLRQILPTMGDAPVAARKFAFSAGAFPPSYLAWSWVAALAAFVAAAAWRGTRRDRLAIGASVAALVASFVGVSAAVLRQNGFGIQARHIVPAIALVCLVATAACDDRLLPGRLRAGVSIGAGVILCVAWGYLAKSFMPTSIGLVVQYVSPGEALRGLASVWTVVFVAGVALTCGAAAMWSAE